MKLKIMFSRVLGNGKVIDDHLFHTSVEKAEEFVAFLLFSRDVSNVKVVKV